MNDPEIQAVEFDATRLTFRLRDGRTVSAPLSFYPTLQNATPTEQANFVVYPFSVHWPDLDVDLDAECLLRGAHELPVYAQKAAHRELLVREDLPKDS
jgi:hypothetical protein